VSTPFDIDAGIYQGQISDPVNHTITGSGEFTYVLGHDLEEQIYNFNPGDSVTLEQTAVINDGDLLRLLGRIRCADPANIPTNYQWELDVEVVGSYTYTFVLESDTFAGLSEVVVNEDALGLNTSEDHGGGAATIRFTLRFAGPASPTPLEAELPAVYIDDVVFEEIGDPIFLNQRFPEPADTGIPAGATHVIRIQISDTTGIGIDASNTQVTVEGVTAYDGGAGGFQPGFSGSAALTGTNNSDFTISLDLSAQSYGSEQVIDVRVISETTGGANTIDETYSYTMADTQAPSIVSATAIEKTLIRVVFDEPVKQVAAGNSDDALNPDNYGFTRQTAPAANVEASIVTAVSATEVEVCTDIELTFGASYQLAMQNVEDLAGNAITTPGSVTSFEGFTPVIPDGRRYMLLNMLPSINLREDVTQDLTKFVGVLQETVNLLLERIDRFTDVIDIDVAPEFYVDRILCDLGNPFDFVLDLIDKRRLARVLVDIYREKGTCAGIRNAVRFFVGVEVECDSFNVGDYWSLGDSYLGDDTILGPSEQALLYSFQIISTEVQITTVTVNGNDDGDYIITINSTDTTYTATGKTVEEIRDRLIAQILLNPDLPVTVAAQGTAQLVLTSVQGTAFNISVTAPVLGNLTYSTTTTPTPFTDAEVATILDLANYMKPAHTHCVRVIQPTPPELIYHWELGISLLGETTLLH
jgi:phage tail-like protein